MIEDYETIYEAEMTAQGRVDSYEDMKVQLVDKVTEYAIDNDLDVLDTANLVCFLANSYGSMPIDEVVQTISDVLCKVQEEKGEIEELQFLETRMNPFYQAVIDEDGKLQVIMTLKDDGDS